MNRTCHWCEVDLNDHWNLAPTGATEDGKRVYEDNVLLCDDCYDGWCTRHDIQPLP